MATPAATSTGAAASPGTKYKIIFADFAVAKYASIIDSLQKRGFQVEGVTDPATFLKRLSEESFDLCVVNLLLGGIGPYELLRNLKATSKNNETRVIVISKQVQRMNIQNTMKAGANDFVADPVDNENLLNRILYHLSPKKVIELSEYRPSQVNPAAMPFMSLLVESTEILCVTEQAKETESFFNILGKIAQLTDSNRTSLMILDVETDSGVVLASSDDPSFFNFAVTLNKYPEILHVLHSGKFVLIDDVSQNALTQKIGEQVKSISIGSLMVFPIRYGGEVVGVLNIRRAKAVELPSMDILRVLQAIANTLAAHSNTKMKLRRLYRDFNPKS
jgi:DNA-binding response OmpR family regulator